jgi:hypothetical protein
MVDTAETKTIDLKGIIDWSFSKHLLSKKS